MHFLSTKENVELLASRLETATYILTLLAAVAGITFLLVNRRLQRFTKAEADAMQQRIVETNALSEAAKADAATARARTEEYKTERAKVELRLKEVELAHSKLATTNAENEKQIGKLKESQAPRIISAAQSSQISSLLRPFSGQTVRVDVYSSDNETTVFSNQIVSTLQAAGLKIDGPNIALATSGSGLAIVVHDPQTAPPLAGTIQHAFKAAGFDMGGVALPTMVKAGECAILVGEKPKTP